MITPLEPERRAGLPQPESPIDGVVVGVVLRGLVGGTTMNEIKHNGAHCKDVESTAH